MAMPRKGTPNFVAMRTMDMLQGMYPKMSRGALAIISMQVTQSIYNYADPILLNPDCRSFLVKLMDGLRKKGGLE